MTYDEDDGEILEDPIWSVRTPCLDYRDIRVDRDTEELLHIQQGSQAHPKDTHKGL
jgi:hypothetical protein